MLRRVRLVRFKNFEDATLSLGPFTLLVGANAAGKSNVREALRFLHGVGRGYTLAEIFGGKYTAGERQWDGLRGGVREASFRGAGSFVLEVDIDLAVEGGDVHDAGRYSIEVEIAPLPRVASESLRSGGTSPILVYEARPYRNTSGGQLSEQLIITVNDPDSIEGPDSWIQSERSDAPALTRLLGEPPDAVISAERALGSMRFIDLAPAAMCQPSVPGQANLSDRGENLSSVLQTLCSREDTKSELLHWLRALTPMDVVDLKFPADLRGQVLLVLVEKDGTELSAYSASEGTLRFLGLLAALLSPEPTLFFLEEIESGLHPSRLRLLLDLISARARDGRVQVVATTHSPALLAQLDDELLAHASLVYRLEGEPSGRIVRLVDVPDAERVLRGHDRGDLLASGWFEDMMEFAASPREPTKRASPEESGP
ncbi:AAA family ATPase [Sorangium sp. So ce426]|uniref:AAA family ATPase n=1 Tax=unclassified Sorangium TaxID=2621164 RepID=UPI003F5C030D